MNNFVATVRWTVCKKWDAHLLRTFLRDHCHISKRTLAAIKFKGGTILLNGKEVTVRAFIYTGDEVTVMLPAEPISVHVQPENIPLDIVFEDDHVLVVNKQAGIPTIPSREHPSHTLANGVLGYYKNKKIPATFHAVNRLDKDTSGLLLIAKHRFAHDRLSKLQQAGKVHRNYIAFITGKPEKNIGTINAPIGRKDNSIILREVRADGQKAKTEYEVMSSLPAHGTIVKVKLHTGRTHQIRVHFAHIGCPLLGDDLYGGGVEQIRRQALHSYQLQFEHPIYNKVIEVNKELPADMKALMGREKIEIYWE